MLYYDWKCLTKYYACPLAAEIRICLTFFLLEKQHISIRPSAFFPARPHFFLKTQFFFDSAAQPARGTLIYRMLRRGDLEGKLAQSVCSPSPLQVQMLCGMFDVASEGNNAGCQVGKSQAREAAAIRKTCSGTRHDFNKIPPVLLLKALVQGKLKSRVQLKEITV